MNNGFQAVPQIITKTLSVRGGRRTECTPGQLAAVINQSAVTVKQEQPVAVQKTKAAWIGSHTSASDFLGVISHEFRTPLNLIMGYTEMIQEELAGPVTEEQGVYLQRIMMASEDILALVLSVLNVDTIESGGVELNEREVKLGTLLRELRSDLSLQPQKGVTLAWDIPADLPIIRTDPAKLKLVLHRLIDNAVKFTYQGQVRVSARVLGSVGQIEFAVSDTGVGISKDALRIVFEKFRQVDASMTRKHDGMGLGLFIAKKLTEILGGELGVTSEPGKGSTFTVTVPMVV